MVGTAVGLGLALAVCGCGGAGGDEGGGSGEVLAAPAQDVPGGCPATPAAGTVCTQTPARGRVSYRTDDLQRLRVREATYQQADGQSQWTITLRLEEDSGQRFGSLTREAARDQGLLVLVVPGTGDVISAPQVTQPITGGEVQIVVADGRAEARRIVSLITSDGG